ncbi:hypothetical protein CVD19_12410 [Bacillus sp. T33-2]|nr:hypothetical protein CVD19_12410 [Bacillus sp. T33-2]
MQLIMEALELGIGKEEIRAFLNSNNTKELCGKEAGSRHT